MAYAIGRRFGNAVDRNRARRRLRAALDRSSPDLAAGVAYLVGADRRVMTVDFPDLVTQISAAIRRCSPSVPTGEDR